MKCECPKCSSNIDINEPDAPEKGGFVKCPDCGDRFWLQREPFLLKGFKKDGNIYCVQCGEKPGADTFCKSCYAQFADYWLAQLDKPTKRQAQSKGVLRTSFGQRSQGYQSNVHEAPKASKGIGIPSKNITIVLFLIAALLCGAVSGSSWYLGYKEKREFSDYYIKTLYVIQSGIDHSHRSLKEMLKTKRALSDEEAKLLKKVDSQITIYKAKLATPPDEYSQAAANMNALFKVYSDYYELSKSETGASPDLPIKVEKLDDTLAKTQVKLKRELPAELSQDIQTVIVKYKNLDFLTK